MLRRLFACFAFALPLPAAADLGLNIYGLAYHFDRSRAREAGLNNELIAGLGLRYRVPHSEQMSWVLEGGAYRDSGRNTALVAGAGALWKVSGGWRLGGALVGFKSDTYKRGKAFLAPLPLLTYDYRSVTLNFTYVPRVAEINDVAALAFWVTWWP